MKEGGSQDREKQGSLVNFLGSKSGVLHPDLPEAQAAILDLLQKGKTPAEIAKIRNTSIRAVYSVVKKLAGKGLWRGGSQGGSQSTTTPASELSHRYRAHAFVVTLPVHDSSQKFKLAVQQSNAGYRDGHKIMLSPRFVKIFGSSGFSFYGVDADDAVAQAWEYWLRFIRRLEGRWNVLLLKADCAFEMRYEVGETDNELAERLIQKKEYLRIRTTDDGKEWLITDNSFNLSELETNHHRTAGVDMQEVVAPYFNSLRDNGMYLRKPHESWAMHDEVVAAHLQLQSQVQQLQFQLGQLQVLHAGLVQSQQATVELMKLGLQQCSPKVEFDVPTGWLL